MLDKVSRKNIDMKLICPDIRELRSDLCKALVPKWHGKDNSIGLGRRGDVLLPGLGQREGKTNHSIASTLCKNRLLHGQFLFTSGIQPASDLRILAFVVFANNTEIDLAGPKVLDGRLNTLKKSCRPQVHILLKAPPNRDQQPPE